MHRVRLAILISILLPLFGCSDGLVDVKAKVLLDGKPLDGASVTLVGQGNSGGREAYGSTDENGMVESFTTTKRGDGVMPGQYNVIVNKSPEAAPKEIPRIDPKDPEALKRFLETTKSGNVAYTRSALPRIYLDPSRTPLQCEVGPDTEQLVFELVSTAGD